MVAGEGDGDEDQVRLSRGDVVGYGVGCLRAEPGGRADLRLPAEPVGVGVVQARHYGGDGGGDFGGVGVA